MWRRGSVVGSWLIDLTADAFARSPNLDDFAGRVSDSGRAAGPWWPRSTKECRPRSSRPRSSNASSPRGLGEFTDKVLSAMRSEFGGHAEKKQ